MSTMVGTAARGTSSGNRSAGGGRLPRTPLAAAWLWTALVPVFFFIAFGVASVVYALTGYDPSAGAIPPLWADLAAAVPFLAILLTPCVGGVLQGRRAALAGVRAGLVPAVLAALLGVGAILLVVLNLA